MAPDKPRPPSAKRQAAGPSGDTRGSSRIGQAPVSLQLPASRPPPHLSGGPDPPHCSDGGSGGPARAWPSLMAHTLRPPHPPATGFARGGHLFKAGARGGRGWGLQAVSTDSLPLSHPAPRPLPHRDKEGNPPKVAPLSEATPASPAAPSWGREWIRAPQVRVGSGIRRMQATFSNRPFIPTKTWGEGGSRGPPPHITWDPEERLWTKAWRRGEAGWWPQGTGQRAAPPERRTQGGGPEAAGEMGAPPGSLDAAREQGGRLAGLLRGSARTAGPLRRIAAAAEQERQNYNFWKSGWPLCLSLNGTVF